MSNVVTVWGGKKKIKVFGTSRPVLLLCLVSELSLTGRGGSAGPELLLRWLVPAAGAPCPPAAEEDDEDAVAKRFAPGAALQGEPGAAAQDAAPQRGVPGNGDAAPPSRASPAPGALPGLTRGPGMPHAAARPGSGGGPGPVRPLPGNGAGPSACPSRHAPGQPRQRLPQCYAAQRAPADWWPPAEGVGGAGARRSDW